MMNRRLFIKSIGALFLAPSIALSAFPVIEDISDSQTIDDTTHTIVAPSGVVSGDLVISHFCSDGHPTVSGYPTGWVQIAEDNNGGAAAAEAWYWFADGSLSNFDVTTDSGQRTTHYTFRISGAHASSAPEATSNNANSSTPSPPSNTASWGAEDNLWLGLACTDNGTITYSGFPETANNESQNTGGAATGCSSGICSVEDASATRDIGDFTISASENNIGISVVIRPAAAAASDYSRSIDYGLNNGLDRGQF